MVNVIHALWCFRQALPPPLSHAHVLADKMNRIAELSYLGTHGSTHRTCGRLLLALQISLCNTLCANKVDYLHLHKSLGQDEIAPESFMEGTFLYLTSSSHAHNLVKNIYCVKLCPSPIACSPAWYRHCDSRACPQLRQLLHPGTVLSNTTGKGHVMMITCAPL